MDDICIIKNVQNELQRDEMSDMCLYIVLCIYNKLQLPATTTTTTAIYKRRTESIEVNKNKALI